MRVELVFKMWSLSLLKNLETWEEKAILLKRGDFQQWSDHVDVFIQTLTIDYLLSFLTVIKQHQFIDFVFSFFFLF